MHPKYFHLKQVQHCTYLPLQITLLAHTEQGKIDQDFDERCGSIGREGKQEDEKERGRRAKEEKNRRPILE